MALSNRYTNKRLQSLLLYLIEINDTTITSNLIILFNIYEYDYSNIIFIKLLQLQLSTVNIPYLLKF